MEDPKPWARSFDDFRSVPDRVLAFALPAIDSSLISLALKTASPELRQRVLGFLEQRTAELILEEMEFMAPVRLPDVQDAQNKVVCKVNRRGEIF